MKTSWSTDYLYRKFGNGNKVHQWRAAKRQELKEKTGIKWVDWSAHGKIVFHPNWTKDTPESYYPATAKRILETVDDKKFGMAFLAIWKELPHIPLAMILGVSLWLTKNGFATPIQGRCGGAYGIRKR